MSSKYRDIWLGIGLGILGYCAAFAVHQQLLAILKVSEVPKESKGPEQPSADDIKLDTLEKLTPNVNRDIANAATRIVAERASQGLTYELLLRGIIGDDTEKRNRSLTSLLYLHTRVSDDVLKPHYGTFKAIINCLCTESMMDEAASYEEELKKGSTYYRSQHYDDTLRLLRQLISDCDKYPESRQGIKDAVRAGAIKTWLANYPWGGLNKAQKDKQEVFKNRAKKANGDTIMQYLILRYANDYERFPEHNDAGLKQLHVHGLVDEDFVREFDRPDLRAYYNKKGILVRPGEDPDAREPDHGDRMAMLRAQLDLRESLRAREESMEEQQLRRRRREAMVIGGEGRPFALADTMQHTGDDSQASNGDLRDLNEANFPDDFNIDSFLRDNISDPQLHGIGADPVVAREAEQTAVGGASTMGDGPTVDQGPDYSPEFYEEYIRSFERRETQ